MCTRLCKANTAKQRVERGREGKRTDGRTAGGPAPSAPSSVAPNKREAAASDNTNSTMIGSDGSRSAAREGQSRLGLSIAGCFFSPPQFASADQRGGRQGEWSVGWVCGC